MSRTMNRALARLFTAFPRLGELWARRLALDEGEVPWAIPRKELSGATLALISTGGVHLKDQARFDLSDPNGDPTYREIAADVPASSLITTHDYYDRRDAERDLNLVFPLERLRELIEHRALGGLPPVAYSLMGHIDGPHLVTLIRRTAPEIARRLASAGADYALLVPA